MNRRGSGNCDWRLAIGDWKDRKVLEVFQRWILGLFLSALVCSIQLTGCVSKSKADARARAAFLAGQQQAAQMARQTQLQGPTVTVMGEVRNALVRWTVDLTLAKAVIAADYYGPTDPVEIVIQRDGKEIPCDPKKLLGGEDVQLEPNDVIVLRR